MTDKTIRGAALAELPSAYERWRTSRLGRITDALERDLLFRLIGSVVGLRALDVGCGDGQLALTLANAGARVFAVDTNPRMLAAARRCFKAVTVEVHLLGADTQALPFKSESFDVITAVTVLCFVHEPDRALAEMARVLKPGGRLVIGELGRYSSWAAWRRIRGWFGHATWRAARFRTVGELRDLAARAGLGVQTVRAAVFYPPVGLAAAVLAPLEGWLGRRLIVGGAFLALVAMKIPDEALETEANE